MNVFVLGGSASGKSAFAESVSVSLSKKNAQSKLVYFATLDSDSGGDSAERIARHQNMRKGKGFFTVELSSLFPSFSFCSQFGAELSFEEVFSPFSTVLFEDVGNLVARAMFQKDGVLTESEAVEKSISLIELVAKWSANTIFVSNEVSLEMSAKNPPILSYLSALSRVNAFIASLSHQSVFVIAGIPVALNDEAKKTAVFHSQKPPFDSFLKSTF